MHGGDGRVTGRAFRTAAAELVGWGLCSPQVQPPPAGRMEALLWCGYDRDTAQTALASVGWMAGKETLPEPAAGGRQGVDERATTASACTDSEEEEDEEESSSEESSSEEETSSEEEEEDQDVDEAIGLLEAWGVPPPALAAAENGTGAAVWHGHGANQVQRHRVLQDILAAKAMAANEQAWAAPCANVGTSPSAGITVPTDNGRRHSMTAGTRWHEFFAQVLGADVGHKLRDARTSLENMPKTPVSWATGVFLELASTTVPTAICCCCCLLLLLLLQCCCCCCCCCKTGGGLAGAVATPFSCRSR